MIRPPPKSPLFPYPTLSRSVRPACRLRAGRRRRPESLAPGRFGGIAVQDDRRPARRRNGQERGILADDGDRRSEEHTSELQSLRHLVCRLLLEKKKNTNKMY